MVRIVSIVTVMQSDCTSEQLLAKAVAELSCTTIRLKWQANAMLNAHSFVVQLRWYKTNQTDVQLLSNVGLRLESKGDNVRLSLVTEGRVLLVEYMH